MSEKKPSLYVVLKAVNNGFNVRIENVQYDA